MTFMDSGAFIALIVTNDTHHAAAVKYHNVTSSPRHTLDAIVGETYTHLRYRFGKSAGLAFLDIIDRLRAAGELKVHHIDDALSASAEAILRQYADIALSYTDAVALAWLRQHKEVRSIFGFDQHWRVEGHILAP